MKAISLLVSGAFLADASVLKHSASSGATSIATRPYLETSPPPTLTMHAKREEKTTSTFQTVWSWTRPTPGPDMYWQRLPWNWTKPLKDPDSTKTLQLLPLYTITVQNQLPQDTELYGNHAIWCNADKHCDEGFACVAPLGWRRNEDIPMDLRYGWCRNTTEYPSVDPRDLIVHIKPPLVPPERRITYEQLKWMKNHAGRPWANHSSSEHQPPPKGLGRPCGEWNGTPCPERMYCRTGKVDRSLVKRRAGICVFINEEDMFA